ncbi:MAG: LysR family transcriptional regulator [Burkholderiales bacterium]|nr:LysR family transcriptional regulator [Burkholderiales bacterium]
MEIRHLRYAVAVADTLSFTRAAEQLAIAQPPLSHQIRALEIELGLPLFHRTKRKVELSAAGEAFIERARRVLSDVEEMKRASQRIYRGEVGRIVIGFLSSIAFDYFPLAMRAFRSRYPDVEIELRELKQLPLLHALKNESVDLAFIRNFFDDPKIESHVVLHEHFLAVLPVGHPLARYRSISPERLKTEPFVTVMKRGTPSVYGHTLSICQAAGFHPRVVQEANDIQACVGLVSAGMGIAIVPDSISHLSIPGVTYRKLRGVHDQMEIVIAWRRNDRNSVVQRFVEVALTTENPPATPDPSASRR